MGSESRRTQRKICGKHVFMFDFRGKSVYSVLYLFRQAKMLIGYKTFCHSYYDINLMVSVTFFSGLLLSFFFFYGKLCINYPVFL